VQLNLADCVVIKRENLFLLTLRDGRLPAAEPHPLGLWYRDCRFLRTHELLLDGAPLLLLQASFRSWRIASLYFLTLPIALVGGLLAAYLGSKVISLGSLVGFLTVFGIVARNGIMLISHCQHLEKFEGVAFGPELVVRGAKERLVPILMTVLTTGLALVPLIIAGSIPGQEIEHPMAVVILGGLVTATLLNLFVVPALYLRFAKGKIWDRGNGNRIPDVPRTA